MATTSRKRDHLGIGWRFPIRPIAGALTYIKYEDDVEQSINVILETTRKERIMLPAFGAGLRDYVFASNSPQTQRAVEVEVRRALLENEERIDVESVRATAPADTPNVLLVEIDYVVRSTNSTFNMVFPFYLTEGA